MYIEVSVFECFLKDACICMIDHTHNPNHDLWGSLISHKLSRPLSVCDYHHSSSAVYCTTFLLFHDVITFMLSLSTDTMSRMSYFISRFRCIYFACTAFGEINRKISNIHSRLNMVYWMGLGHDMKSPKLSF